VEGEGAAVKAEAAVFVGGAGENIVDVEATASLGVGREIFGAGGEERLGRTASKWCMITSLEPLKRATRCLPSSDT
jgi:hypothetical protein